MLSQSLLWHASYRVKVEKLLVSCQSTATPGAEVARVEVVVSQVLEGTWEGPSLAALHPSDLLLLMLAVQLLLPAHFSAQQSLHAALQVLAQHGSWDCCVLHLSAGDLPGAGHAALHVMEGPHHSSTLCFTAECASRRVQCLSLE